MSRVLTTSILSIHKVLQYVIGRYLLYYGKYLRVWIYKDKNERKAN